MNTAAKTLLCVILGSCMLAAPRAGGGTAPATQPGGPEQALAAFKARMAGDVAQAREILHKARAAGVDDPVLWFELARLDFSLCEFDQAWEEIGQAIQRDRKNARYHFWAGQIATFNAVMKFHEDTSGKASALQMQRARAALQRAVELKSDLHEARFQLINLCLREPGRNSQAAEKELKILKGLDPVFGAKAECLFHEKSADECLRIWQQAAEANPSRWDAHEGLAGAFLRAGQYDKAIQQFGKARALNPEREELLFGMARCYQAIRNWDQQAQCYQQYLDSPVTKPSLLRITAMRHLASVEKKRGRQEEAAKLQETANAMDPRYGKRGAVHDDVPDLFTAP